MNVIALVSVLVVLPGMSAAGSNGGRLETVLRSVQDDPVFRRFLKLKGGRPDTDWDGSAVVIIDERRLADPLALDKLVKCYQVWKEGVVRAIFKPAPRGALSLAAGGVLKTSLSCAPPGFPCDDSGQCCAGNSCQYGHCDRGSSSCIPPGGGCSSSVDCCGVSMCVNGSCDNASVGCTSPGGSCQSAIECCGTSICRSGSCDAPSGFCTPQGGACISSLDCCGISVCSDNVCR